MRYEGLDVEMLYEAEMEFKEGTLYNRLTEELEENIDAAQKAAEKDGKRGYDVADILISAYRVHRHVDAIHSLVIEENFSPSVIALIGHVTLLTGEDVRFAVYISR